MVAASNQYVPPMIAKPPYTVVECWSNWLDQWHNDFTLVYTKAKRKRGYSQRRCSVVKVKNKHLWSYQKEFKE